MGRGGRRSSRVRADARRRPNLVGARTAATSPRGTVARASRRARTPARRSHRPPASGVARRALRVGALMNDPLPSPVQSAPPEPSFDVLALGSDVRKAVDAMGYQHPTPVQRAVFEPAVAGRSLVVQARTGTGKTSAFGLPIVDRIVRVATKAVQAMVLCPTRELALQVGREIEQLGKFRGVRVAAIYGGASMSKQIDELDAGAQIVVGTPGRVLDHLRQGTLKPGEIRVLVLDEADEMLSMGFAKELNAILESLPKNRQGLFFSATLPPDIERLARAHLRETELITLSSDQVGALEVDHYVYVTQAGDK